MGNRFSELKLSSPMFRHALRAAIAITAAVAMVQDLGLSHALWVPITVLVVMRPSLGGTLQISWKRMAGTLVGAVAGVGLAYIPLPAAGVAGLALVLLFFMFYFKGRHYLAFTIFLTADLVLVLSAAFPHAWQSGAERLLDTFLGIGIGLAASFLVWPNFARKNLREAMGDLISAQHHHFQALCQAYFNEDPDSANLLSGRLAARTQLDACAEKCADAAIEPGLRAAQRQELMNLVEIFTRNHRTLTALASIVKAATGTFRWDIRPDLEDLMGRVEMQFEQLDAYARNGEEPKEDPKFKACFNRFMARLGTMRARGEFDRLSLDSRNSASSFILQIDRIGTGLEQARAGLSRIRAAR
jgi:uncharacterized membrane protein YccC